VSLGAQKSKLGGVPNQVVPALVITHHEVYWC